MTKVIFVILVLFWANCGALSFEPVWPGSDKMIVVMTHWNGMFFI